MARSVTSSGLASRGGRFDAALGLLFSRRQVALRRTLHVEHSALARRGPLESSDLRPAGSSGSSHLVLCTHVLSNLRLHGAVDSPWALSHDLSHSCILVDFGDGLPQQLSFLDAVNLRLTDLGIADAQLLEALLDGLSGSHVLFSDLFGYAKRFCV